VTRYRLDSQFRCSYLEFRKKIAGNTGKKTAGNYLPFISGSRLPVTSNPVMQLSVTSFPVMQLPVAHAHAITSGTPTNDKWMVLLYYLRYLITPLLSSNVSCKQDF
jgi:hypothetical protein